MSQRQHFYILWGWNLPKFGIKQKKIKGNHYGRIEGNKDRSKLDGRFRG